MSENFETALMNYVEKIQATSEADFATNYPKLTAPVFTVTMGKKFAKVCEKVSGDALSGSVFCFVEIETGNIYKPATWSRPAKGVRGNIYSTEGLPLTSRSLYRVR